MTTPNQFNPYTASIPGITRSLENLSAILKKAEAHAEARKIDPSVLIQSRLYPDMFPLARQVQIASDTAKGAAARLSGAEIPGFADTETTFAELQDRISRTLTFIGSVSAEAIAASADKTITMKTGGTERTLSTPDYLFGFVLPQLYFHVTTAYDILRHNGVDLGKRDYLGA